MRLANVILLVLLALFVLACLTWWARRHRPAVARRAYVAALVLSALPWFALFASVSRTVADFRDAGSGPAGFYPGLVAFCVGGALLALLVVIGGLRLARTRSMLAGLTPLALAGLVWYGVVPLLRWRAPGHLFEHIVVWWDNMIWIWAAGFAALAAVLLVTTGAIVIRSGVGAVRYRQVLPTA